jgi:hypothetical protein
MATRKAIILSPKLAEQLPTVVSRVMGSGNADPSTVTATGDAPILNAPTAWIRITGKTAIPGGRYRYTCEVIANPFSAKLTPALDVRAASRVAYCATEFGDVTPTSDATASLKGAPVVAQLFWTWIESGDPTNGYWAWWFTPGGGALPQAQYQYQGWFAVSQNQMGFSFVCAHPMI